MKRERRQSGRRKSFIDTGKLTPMTSKKFTSSLACKIVNIGPRGISFHSDLDLEVGQLVRVAVNGNNAVYCIKWKKVVNDLNNGIYRYGLEQLGWPFENHASA